MRKTLVLAATAIVIAAALGGFKWRQFDAERQSEARRRELDARPRVLVFKTNMHEDMTATEDSVVVRPVTDAELGQYLANRHKYMPPLPLAVDLRILNRNVHADEPILKEHFVDFDLPGPTLTPEPLTRVVQVQSSHQRDNAIRKGVRVDVYLSANIVAGPDNEPVLKTARIAQSVRVLRGPISVWKFRERDDETPPQYAIEVNPYRAALIEFAKNRGTITLMPTGPNSPKLDPDQAKLEEDRVISVTELHIPISDRDLEEAFGLIPKKAELDEPNRGWVGRLPGPNAPEFVGPLRGKLIPCATCPGGTKLIPLDP